MDNLEVKKTTRMALVYEVENVEKHPNADLLELVSIGEYKLISQKGLYQKGDLVVHIQPDSLIDTTRSEFSSYAKGDDKIQRVKAVKIRGLYSPGIIIRAPSNAKVGDDLANFFGVGHYQPEVVNQSKLMSPVAQEICIQEGWDQNNLTLEQREQLHNKIKERYNKIKGEDFMPAGFFPKSDAENIKNKHRAILSQDELVIITEKIHGFSVKMCCDEEGKVYVGSRNNWKIKPEPGNPFTPKRCDFWKCYENHQDVLYKFLSENPNLAIYGEGYGLVKNFHYGVDGKTIVKLAIYDIFDRKNMVYLDVEPMLKLCEQYNLPTVPVLRLNHRFDYDELVELSSGSSLIPNAKNIREGVVVKPMKEKFDESIGRVILKCISNEYLSKN